MCSYHAKQYACLQEVNEAMVTSGAKFYELKRHQLQIWLLNFEEFHIVAAT